MASNGWFSSVKSASDIKQSKVQAAAKRRAKNGRAPPPKAKTTKKPKKQTKLRTTKRDDSFINDDSDEESFHASSESDVSFTSGKDETDDDDEEEDGWKDGLSDGSDAADDVIEISKPKLSRSQRASKRRSQTKISLGAKSRWQQDAAADSIEESPVPPPKRRGKQSADTKRSSAKKSSPVDSSEDLSESEDEDDIYAAPFQAKVPLYSGKRKKGDSDSTFDEEDSQKRDMKKRSRYFTHDDEEKKDDSMDENKNQAIDLSSDTDDDYVGSKAAKKKSRRKVESDSDSDFEHPRAYEATTTGQGDFDSSDAAANSEQVLDDTPTKQQHITDNDYVDDTDEEVALEWAVKESSKASHKRLKKKKNGKKSNKQQVKTTTKAVYKDDTMDDPLADDSDVELLMDEDDEVDVYETAVNSEEQTAQIVLREANALSRTIVSTVSGWYGMASLTESQDSNGSQVGGVQGLILDEGALNVGCYKGNVATETIESVCQGDEQKPPKIEDPIIELPAGDNANMSLGSDDDTPNADNTTKSTKKKTAMSVEPPKKKRSRFQSDSSDSEADEVAVARLAEVIAARKKSKAAGPDANKPEAPPAKPLIYTDSDSDDAEEVRRLQEKLDAKKKLMEGSKSADEASNPEGAKPLASATKSQQTVQIGCNDPLWITDATMKQIMPEVKLAEYQLLGVNWMALLNRTKFGLKGKNGEGLTVNGILADEMGLGKTVQTIAFLAWLNQQNRGGKEASKPQHMLPPNQLIPKKVGSDDEDDGIESDNDAEAKMKLTAQQRDSTHRPHLIVVPASVLSNWMNEFKKFAPSLSIVKYHGSLSEREMIRANFNSIIGKVDAVLTTFSYFSSDSNKVDRNFLRKFQFDYLVVDEGHSLKNAKGLRYKNLNKFKTSHRLLLTGTPVQNSPKELMSLLCFLMPLFDSKTKSSKRRGYDGDDDEDDGGEKMLEHFVSLEGGADSVEAYRKLKQLFAPFVLRRKKEDVLQLLPPKNRRVDLVPMDESTRCKYDSILSSHIKARSNKNDAAAQKHLFTALRKAANHPLLLRTRFTEEKERDELARLAHCYGLFGNDESLTLQLVRGELEGYSDFEVHCAALDMIADNPSKDRKKYLEKYTLKVEDLFSSPKFVRLQKLLPELIGKGHRILVFSQWTKVLDLLGLLLDNLSMKYSRLDGSTQVSDRQGMIDDFTKDTTIPVFLLSTRAGGMGLNLVAADVCILHDLDFNPFNDLQAEDRVHRIGQTKPVTVIKLVTQGSVDEDIYRIQERKAKMNDAIMGSKANKKAENEEISKITNAAVERFMNSPTGKEVIQIK